MSQAVDDGTRRDGSTAETLAAGFSQTLAARTLLVLDNCEHLIDGCARVAETLVKLCPAITILATSREALRIEGERVVRVAPLAYADAAADSPALSLLIDRLVDADYRRYSELRAQDHVLAARICRHLDGLPLALELAAARARDLPWRTSSPASTNALRSWAMGAERPTGAIIRCAVWSIGATRSSLRRNVSSSRA